MAASAGPGWVRLCDTTRSAVIAAGCAFFEPMSTTSRHFGHCTRRRRPIDDVLIEALHAGQRVSSVSGGEDLIASIDCYATDALKNSISAALSVVTFARAIGPGARDHSGTRISAWQIGHVTVWPSNRASSRIFVSQVPQRIFISIERTPGGNASTHPAFS